MRELRPLLLPRLTAAKYGPGYAIEEITSRSTDSFFSFSDDPSAPATPTYSLPSHTRYPSSASSLASSPPKHDHLVDMTNSASKLPKLAEEPFEPEDFDELSDDDDEDDDDDEEDVDDHIHDEYEDEPLSPCLCDVEVCAHTSSTNHGAPASLISSSEFDWPSGFPIEDGDVSPRFAKRRRSGESSVSNIAMRIESRFRPLSRRLRYRKRGLTFGSSSTRTSTPSHAPSTRSSSFSSAVVPCFDLVDLAAVQPPTPRRSLPDRRERDPMSITVPPPEDPIDREALASTPLLPPMMKELSSGYTSPILSSPLQSPTVAEPGSTFSLVGTPVGTPQFPGIPTPPLSTKPSISSFQLPRSGNGTTIHATAIPSSELSPIMGTDQPEDEWSFQLGHANFTIYPEPYVPDLCDLDGCRQQLADWNEARCNFIRHQVRTGEHFGVTSKTYRLTEQKWVEIEAQWKKSREVALANAAIIGHELCPSTPAEPAPLIEMPSLNDPRGEGKFPKLGDEDIVGPMIQVASQMQQKPSRKAAFLKLFSDIKVSTTFLGRSTAGSRTSR